jgi:hypothetical protein
MSLPLSGNPTGWKRAGDETRTASQGSRPPGKMESLLARLLECTAENIVYGHPSLVPRDGSRRCQQSLCIR